MKADLSLYDFLTDLTQLTQETMAKEIQAVLSHEVDQLIRLDRYGGLHFLFNYFLASCGPGCGGENFFGGHLHTKLSLVGSSQLTLFLCFYWTFCKVQQPLVRLFLLARRQLQSHKTILLAGRRPVSYWPTGISCSPIGSLPRENSRTQSSTIQTETL